ncbi:hypothetical protein RhiXN_10385 [Rhizoctonia solani]|uniref:DUF6533 domain-containing protein n=1 Tax=Rhizoctonia solani TaxID=456999 RepID=A0A8H8P1L3_9AGAM|nr:uncharacterized protein RhiXN_10385 [Rhizoctonia solani]QRW24061.1 hypothetical protein RhiXN_10385 [Rhizoctonia solani]
MSLANALLDLLLDAYHQVEIAKNLALVSVTFFVLDLFVTFETEIKHVWSSKWGYGRIAFHFNRIWSILVLGVYVPMIFSHDVSIPRLVIFTLDTNVSQAYPSQVSQDNNFLWLWCYYPDIQHNHPYVCALLLPHTKPDAANLFHPARGDIVKEVLSSINHVILIPGGAKVAVSWVSGLHSTMPPYVARRVCSPPDLPPYLKNIHELKPIDDIPSDEEFMGIHALIRMASRVVDVPDMGDPVLLARLSEHLFNAQMVKYQSKYTVVFPENTTYTPPVLPVHVPVQLEPVIGAPSEEEIIKVQSAIRSYNQFSSIQSMFDPRTDMELSQHLFDIQMGKQNDVPNEASVKKPKQSIVQVEENAHTNNIGSGANVIELNRSTHVVHDSGFRVEDVIERSNQLVEQTNQLVERSNQITQVSNRLLERYSQATEWPDKTPEKHNEVLERLNGHLEKANQVAVESTKPTERLGDILETINKVLVGIQHAIVRNGKGNSRFALDSLINEKGDTLCKNTGGAWSFRNLFRHAGHNEPSIPIFVNGVMEEFSLPERILGSVLCYHGLGGDLCETGSEVKLKPGTADMARARLSRYWSSCLG